MPQFRARSAIALSSVAMAVVSGVPPLILVPGLTGSALKAKLTNTTMPHFWCTRNTGDDWMSVWLAPGELLPVQKDCLIKRMTLTYDASTDTYSNLPGVEIRSVGFGKDAVGEKNLLYKYEFGKMISHLSDTLGYKLGDQLLLAPYDWRLAGDAHSKRVNGLGGFYVDLQQLIEEQVNASGRKAVVVSHSLGCPTMLYFFQKYVSEAWRAEHIHGWIALSGPWLGSSMQAAAYLSGYTFGMPSWLVPHDYVRPVQINASSGVWLSPNPQAFGNMTMVQTPAHNYTAADLPSLLKIMGNDQAVSIFQKSDLDLDQLQSVPTNVPFQHWYSNGVKTAESFEFAQEITRGFNKAPKVTHFGDGDGIVNLASLRSVERFWGDAAARSTKVFPNVSHFGMLSNAEVLDNLVTYLRGAGEVSGSPTSVDILV